MAHNPDLDKRTTELAQKSSPGLGDRVVIIDYAVPSAPVNKTTPYANIVNPNIALLTALAVGLG